MTATTEQILTRISRKPNPLGNFQANCGTSITTAMPACACPRHFTRNHNLITLFHGVLAILLFMGIWFRIAGIWLHANDIITYGYTHAHTTMEKVKRRKRWHVAFLRKFSIMLSNLLFLPWWSHRRSIRCRIARSSSAFISYLYVYKLLTFFACAASRKRSFGLYKSSAALRLVLLFIFLLMMIGTRPSPLYSILISLKKVDEMKKKKEYLERKLNDFFYKCMRE